MSMEDIKSGLNDTSSSEMLDQSAINKIYELFRKIKVSDEILSNPSRDIFPYKIYRIILALSKRNPEISIDEDGSITLKCSNVDVVYSLGEEFRGDVTITVKDGDIKIDFYHKDEAGKSTIERFAATTGKYVGGEKVVRTMNGSYSLERDDKPPKYKGNGFYEMKEYSSLGIQTGLTGVSLNNNPSIYGEITESTLESQDEELRISGLLSPIDEHMQNNIPPLVSDSLYISYVYTYYRNLEDIEKLHVIDQARGRGTKSGLDFSLGGEHGTDRILRNGVGRLNMLSEEDYSATRDSYYQNCDIEEEKRKSPLSSDLIDKAYEKYHSISDTK